MLQAIRCPYTTGYVYGRGCCPHLPCHYQPLTVELGGDLSRSPGVPCSCCHIQHRGCALRPSAPTANSSDQWAGAVEWGGLL
jgi:hypothetical protein